MTDNADYTPEQGLTTEQIAAGRPGPAEEATPAAADHRYGDDSYNADTYDDDTYDDDNAVPLGDDNAASLGTAPTASEQADRGAPDIDNGGSVATAPRQHASLLDDGELQSITMRWKDIQAEFVDEPTKAVHEADALVAELMQRLAKMFSTERAELENRLADGNDVSTEELRQGLRLYRSFFERLLAA